MKKRVKMGRVKKREKKETSEGEGKEIAKPTESLEQLMRQKDEIQALLSSLEDAYTEATILEDDYNDIKSRNAKKLEEINKKIEVLRKGEAKVPKAAPKAGIPPAEPEMRAPEVPAEVPRIPVVVEERVEEKPKKREVVSSEDLKKLELDLAKRVKEMVEEIGTKITEKDMLEIKNKFAKFETETEKMKALIETIREGKKISDEKIQRVVEGLAEIRTMVYGREASVKEEEVRLEKVMDIMNRLEPEKLIMELGKRDKEVNNQNLRIVKLEETTGEFGEMLKRIEKLMKDIGSLENVISISNEASEKLMNMKNIERNNQKMLDKIQGVYAELSKRMEEFMLYRAKQDRMDDLLNEMMKNIDEINTKAAYFVTKDDLESFRATMRTAAPAAAAPVAADETGELKLQKDEIEMLMKSMEEEFKSGTISKEEYEKMKKANLAKLDEIENKMKGKETVKEAKPSEIAEKPPEKKPEEKPAEKKEDKRPPESVERDEMLLKDLEETFKKGFISKEAYERTKKMILGKG